MAICAAAFPGQDAAPPSQDPGDGFAFEPFGDACGLTLYGVAGSSADAAVEVRVRRGAPSAPLVLLVGSERADLPLPGSACRLLLEPAVTVPVITDAHGRASAFLPVSPDMERAMYVQAVQPAVDGHVATSRAVIIRGPGESHGLTSGDDDTLSTKAAAARHASYRLDTWKQLVHKWKMLGKAGMRMRDIEVFRNESGELVFGGVWEPGSGKHALYRYASWNSFVGKWNELNGLGYRLVDIERVEHGGSTWYYGIWREGSGKYALYSYATWSDFVGKWNELNPLGYRLIDIDISEAGGAKRFIGVWRGGSGKYALYRYDTWSSFVDKWSDLGSSGYELVDLDVTEMSGGTTYYTGVWRAGGPKRALYSYSSWTAFKRKWAELAESGYSLLDFDIAQRNAAGFRYVGTFGKAPAAPPDGPDLRRMAQFLEDALGEDKVVGMSYAISQHGQLAIAGSTGLAQRTPDPEVAMTSKIRSTVASVSKAITAPLVYKLLAENGLTLGTPIEPWLPAGWARGPGFVNNATGVDFRQLLTHTSGLNQEFEKLKALGLQGPWGNGWDGVEFIVGNGTVPSSPRQYKNGNFAMLKMMVPVLWGAAGGPGGAVTKNNVGDRYLQYLHELVLDREGIESIACWPQAGYPEAKSYAFGNLGLAGASNSSSADACGGHANLHFSAQGLTRYAAAFRYNDAIMSPADRQLMRDERAGWHRSFATTGGTGYAHDGAWNRGQERKTRACIMELPYGVNASIIVNSAPPISTTSALRQAFEASFDFDAAPR